MNREQKLWLLLAIFGGISIILPFNYKMEYGLQIMIVGWITFFYSIVVFVVITAKIEESKKPKPIKYIAFNIPKEEIDNLGWNVEELVYDVIPLGIIIRPKEEE